MNTSTPTSAPKRLMLDEKDFFDVLRAQRPSPPATDPQTLDGYLPALIIGPRFIDPRQWIPSFVGEGALMVLLALSMDGVPLTPRDKGPVWIVYPRDDHAILADIRYDMRWVWQLVALHVQ